MAALILILLLSLITGLIILASRQRTQLKTLRQKNNQMSLALDHVNACIYIKDADSRYLYANKPCLELFGVDQDTLKGSPDQRFFPEATARRLREIDLNVLNQQQPSLEEIEVKDQNSGAVTLYLESKYPLPSTGAAGKSLVGISTDITELWTLRQQLEQQAWRDSLTGLYNRLKLDQAFSLHLNRCQQQNKPLSILLIDLDMFKSVNDQYGHQTGDEVLIQVAETINNQCDSDCITGRWGGEEFLIICPYHTQHQALNLAQQIQAAVQFATYPIDRQITASTGIATLNQNDNEDSLLKRADNALYLAKNSGRNRIIASDAIQSRDAKSARINREDV